MSDYVEIYANQFNLEITDAGGTFCFYDSGRIVAYINKEDPSVFHYKNQRSEWSAFKTTDLVHLILNNVPAHG